MAVKKKAKRRVARLAEHVEVPAPRRARKRRAVRHAPPPILMGAGHTRLTISRPRGLGSDQVRLTLKRGRAIEHIDVSSFELRVILAMIQSALNAVERRP